MPNLPFLAFLSIPFGLKTETSVEQMGKELSPVSSANKHSRPIDQHEIREGERRG